MKIKPSDARHPLKPPWDLVLATTTTWVFLTGPTFFGALFVIYIANLSSITDELRLNLVLAVPASTAIGAVGALASRFLRQRLVLIITSMLPFIALAVAIVALVTKFL